MPTKPKVPPDPNAPEVWRQAGELRKQARNLDAQVAIQQHVLRAEATNRMLLMLAARYVRKCEKHGQCECLDRLLALIPDDPPTSDHGDTSSRGPRRP